ncbi:hypothetical protein J7K92_00525 [bacterium]|nr:hypothetical protein [bacterium]
MSILRTIYLYFFSALGLVLVIIGTIRFIDMGLKTFVFTQADQQPRYYYPLPPAPVSLEKISQLSEDDQELSKEEKQLLIDFLKEYKETKEKNEKINPLVAKRQRDASINLSLIIVGLPLYLYHWSIIRRENKKKIS